MLVEIYGGGFRNKGAQLMVSTVISELSKRIDGIEFCMAWRRERPVVDAANANCKLIFPSHLYARRAKAFSPLYKLANAISCFVREKHLKPYGLVPARQCDAVIDISGYAFGDAWGPHKTSVFSIVAKSYRKKNKPVIMLPQMLGPFEDSACRDAFAKLKNEVSFMYARDRISHRQVESIGGFDDILRVSPDITIFNKQPDNGDAPSVADSLLIPNSHVVTKDTTDWTKDSYIEAFTKCYHQIKLAGLSAKILVHDYFGKDEELALEIARNISSDEPEKLIYQNPDPKKLKEAISQTKFIVGSRFHGLVAALSNDIPTIAIGWAHKYGELLYDFGMEEFDIKSSAETPKLLDNLLPQLLDEKTRDDLVGKVNRHRNQLQKINESMWQEVTAQLSHGKHKLYSR